MGDQNEPCFCQRREHEWATRSPCQRRACTSRIADRSLNWLEEDPHRWRLCGLLFLESQMWSQVTRECACGNATKESPVPHPAVLADKPQNRRRQLLNVAILAASVLLSFCLGFGTRNTSQREQLPDAGDQIAIDRLGNPSRFGYQPGPRGIACRIELTRSATIHHSITRRAKVRNLHPVPSSILFRITFADSGNGADTRSISNAATYSRIARRPAGRRSH